MQLIAVRCCCSCSLHIDHPCSLNIDQVGRPGGLTCAAWVDSALGAFFNEHSPCLLVNFGEHEQS